MLRRLLFVAVVLLAVGAVLVAVVAVGAAGVLFFKPKAENVDVSTAADGMITITKTVFHGEQESSDTWKAASLR